MAHDSNPIPNLRAPRSVLVVDDVRAVRRSMTRILSEEGYRVFEAADGIEALEVLELARGRVDVVLMDVLMPDLNGVDLARLIREKWPGQCVVFMSAHPAEVLVAEGLRDPNVLFLAKPFTRAEITTILHRALTRGCRADSETPPARSSGPFRAS